MFSIETVLLLQGDKIAEKVKTLPFKATKDISILPNAAARNRHTRILEQGQKICLTPTAAAIIQLEEWVEAHPDLPEFTNFLAVAYEDMKMLHKAERVIIDAQMRHPEYLFAQTNAANLALMQENIPLAGRFIAEGKGIQYLYPARTQFIGSELWSYVDSACRYLLAINAIDEMEEIILTYYVLLKKDPVQNKKIENLYTKRVPDILKYRFGKMSARIEESKALKQVSAPSEWVEADKEAPFFHHPNEMQWLYENGYDIDAKKLDIILALPRETLIADLSAVMQDTMHRYHYWSEELEWTEASHTFMEHAFVLLATAKSPTSLDILFDMMSATKEFTEFWIGDWADSMILYAMQHLGAESLPLTTEFLHRPNVDTYPKMCVIANLFQLSGMYPELAAQSTAIVTNTLVYMLENPDDDSRVDAPLATRCVSYFTDCQDASKLDLIARAFEHNLVDEFMIGDWESVQKEMKELMYPQKIHPFSTIKDYYASKTEVITAPKPLPKPAPKLPAIIKPINQAVSSKIGRNDLCTCGSGKKYKKCCG
jgi:hypothetical protein